MRANEHLYEIKHGGHTFRGIAAIDEAFEGDIDEPGYPAQCFTYEIYLNGGTLDVSGILDPMLVMKLEAAILEDMHYA